MKVPMDDGSKTQQSIEQKQATMGCVARTWRLGAAE